MNDFEDAVYRFTDDDPERATDMARQFEVAVSTVRRWADGRARPHPRMQRQILDWISQQ